MRQPGNLIDAHELLQRLGSADIRVVDCRFDLSEPQAGRKAYDDGHIPGAVFADLDSDLAAPIRSDSGRHPLPDVDIFAATLGRLGIHNDVDVVVYDAGPGALAARTWWLLRWMGHERVRLLDGGFQEWQTDERPITAGQEKVTPRSFRASPRHDMIVTTAELAAACQSIDALNLIDARDSPRFRGELEPIDTVAGHIPGALNLPFSESLASTGCWKTIRELESLWAEVLGQGRDTSWIAMCGSGVTACHLAISAMQAGYMEPRLYVGSWSEWIRDPARPVAVGEGPERRSEAADLA